MNDESEVSDMRPVEETSQDPLPDSPASRLIGKLRALANEGVEKEYFTHFFAAAGTLSDDSSPVFWEHAPDNRRIFDLASLTKALVTVPLIYRIGQESKLDRAASWMDWLATPLENAQLSPDIRALSIASLLSHSSGLPHWRNYWINRLGEDSESPISCQVRNQRIADKLQHCQLKPEQGSVYSDVGFLTLGLVIENHLGVALDRAFHACQLNMDVSKPWLAFGPELTEAQQASVVPTAFCRIRNRRLFGEVHDENCASLGGVTGNAGLFGSGAGLIEYLRKLWRSEVGQSVIRANSQLRSDTIGAKGTRQLMGWDQGCGPSLGSFADGQGIGHMGFTGSAFLVHPDTAQFALLLTNRVYFARRVPWISRFRHSIFAATDRFLRSHGSNPK